MESIPEELLAEYELEQLKGLCLIHELDFSYAGGVRVAGMISKRWEDTPTHPFEFRFDITEDTGHLSESQFLRQAYAFLCGSLQRAIDGIK